MADVLITPATGLIEFKDNGGVVDAVVQLDEIGNLNITHPGGNLNLGNPGTPVYVGDGINQVDVIFEQNGAVRALSGKTLTLGATGSNVAFAGTITSALNINPGVATTGINLNNNSIIGVNHIIINDPGPNEGLQWAGGSGWQIYESPNDLTTNSGGNLQFVTGSTRRATFNTSGQLELPVATGTAPLVVVSTTRVANLNAATAGTADALTTARTIGGVSFNGSVNINLPGVNIAGNQNTTGSAATLTTGRTIALTGDVTYTSSSFNGSANVTGTATLANSGVTAGTYGSATNIPQIAVDAKGRVTFVSNVAVSIPSGSLTFTGDVSGTGSTGSSTALTLASVGTAGTYTKVTTDAKGRVTAGTTLAASDIPSLDASKITSGVIDAARLPSYVDDVVEAANLAGFPVTGETGKIYVARDTNKVYRWSGTVYVYITSGAVDSVAGKTGVVTLVAGDVGLGNVENKSSATIRGEITSGNVTGALGFTPYNATNPSGYTSNTGTVTAVSGTAPIISSGGTAPAISISAATTSAAGSMSAADKTKLDGIASGAQVNTVTSVAGKTGVVTLAKADVGLGSVDNTADSAKSVASAAILTTTRTIGGVSFNGSANINLPGVNAAGNQNTTGSAATLTTGRTIALTGDVSYTSGAFNGSANVTGTATLATVNSNIGTFNNVTVNAKGLVTAASNVSYLTALTDTLATVTGRGATTGTAIALTNATNATSATTGALVITGGLAVNANIYAKGSYLNANSAGTVINARDVIRATVAVTTATAVDSWAAATYRSAKYLIQITQGTNYQFSEIVVVHNGTTTTMTEYAVVETNGALGTFTSDISGGNARLLVTMASATSATISIDRIAMSV